MAAWLIAALERLSPRFRRVGVAAVAVLGLATALTTLTLEPRPGTHARKPTAASPAPAQSAPERRLPATARGPVSSIGLRRAAGAADRNEQDAAIYTVAGFSGLRQGELRALRWRHVRSPTGRSLSWPAGPRALTRVPSPASGVRCL